MRCPERPTGRSSDNGEPLVSASSGDSGYPQFDPERKEVIRVDEKKEIVFSLRIDEDLYTSVKEIAEKNRRSINSQLIHWIEYILKGDSK